MRSSRIAAVVAAGVGVLAMSAPASAMAQGPAMGAAEGINVALAPGHERPLAHAFGAGERSQPRPTRAGRPAGPARPKLDPKQGVIPGLDLSIGKSHIGPFKQGEHNATYMITVSNLGSIGVGGFFSVTDNLPASMTATSISGVGWDCTLATLTCDRFGVLLPATQFPTIYLTVNVADDAPELVTNAATLSANVFEGPPIVTTATDPTRILSEDEDKGSGNNGGVNIKIDNHSVNHNDNDNTALNLNHTSAHAGAHQAQAQSTQVTTKVHTKVNTKLHVHDKNVVVIAKSRHHHHDC
jgi:uncharacterized repeat protein (TIGR01451 family)